MKEPKLQPREGLLSPTLIPPDLDTALGLSSGFSRWAAGRKEELLPWDLP